MPAKKKRHSGGKKLRSETESTLRRQASLIDLSFEPIFAWHPVNGIVEWNKGAEQVYGYSRREALGRESHSLLQTERQISAHDLLEILKANQGWAGEVRHRTKDGRILTVESRHQLIENDGEHLVLETNHDITETKRVEADLARIAAVALASHDALYGATLDGIIETWNPSAAKLFGYSADEAIGQHLRMLADKDMQAEQLQFLTRAAAGETIGPFDTRRRRKGGKPIDVSVAVAPVKAADGSVTGISASIHDIGERKEWEARQRLMNRELTHRVKNSFAVLLAILRSTLASSASPDAFTRAFSGRLHSLSAAQDILTDSDWKHADLGTLARHLLSPYVAEENQRMEIEGPPVDLGSELAGPFALLLNELATNAVKHGALSAAGGKVQLSWRAEPSDWGQQNVWLTWREIGGPPVKPPKRRGFGSKLIEQGIPGATVSCDFHSTGLVCSLRMILGIRAGPV